MTYIKSVKNSFFIENIIEEIGLSVYEYRVYCALKFIAGKKRSISVSNKEMAERCKVGLSKYKEVKKRLSQPYAKLGGRSLIQITPQYSEDGGEACSVITLVEVSQ